MQLSLLSLEKQLSTSTLTKVENDHLNQHAVELWIKRDDLLHPIVSGNKWRKLKHILRHALAVNTHTLISMGGAYSNHLHALAYIGKLLGLKTMGIIRGEKTPDTITPTLQDALAWGMKLEFISRTDYRQLRQYSGWQDLPNQKPGQYWLPEGGAHTLALAGVAELLDEIEISYDVLCVPCGTGTTLAGLIEAAPLNVKLIGFAALKHADFLVNDVKKHLSKNPANWSINFDYHFGGFAKTTDALTTFIKAFEQEQQVPLEPVYTGKMLYGIFDLIGKNYFKPGSRIIALHTGGLQGKRGFTT